MAHSVSPHTGENAVIIGIIDLLAGSAGGCANVAVGQPLDTVKVKMQTFPHLYRGAFACFVETFKRNGLRRGLYAGTSPALIANIAENSVLFCAYGFCQQAVNLLTKSERPTALEKACAGSLAAFFAALTLCPTELIKCKLQAIAESGHSDTKIGPFKLTANIIRAEGVRGMFRGLSVTIAREMPGYFFFFGGYELTKSFLHKSNEDDDIGLFSTVIAGGVGGVCLWTAIFPFDVIKSRIQVDQQKRTVKSVFTHVLRTEGVPGLYKGLMPTLIRTFPATGALFVAYEYSKHYLTLGANRMNII